MGPSQNKANVISFWVSSIKRYLPYYSRLLFYNAFIVPHFDYCITIWGHCCELTRLLKLQKQAARIILDCNFQTPSQDMFDKLRWLPIPEYVQYRKASLVFKSLNNMLPDYMCNMFQPVSAIHSRCTRQTSKGDLYLPPRAKLCVFRNSIRYSGAQLWNSLPANVRKAPTHASFKSKYFNLHLNQNK